MKLTQLPSIILNLCHVFSLVLYKSIHKQELPDCSFKKYRREANEKKRLQIALGKFN